MDSMNYTVPDFDFADDLEAAQEAFGVPPSIQVFVEGFDDTVFWQQAFKDAGIDTTSITFQPIGTVSNANGKNAVLKAIEEKRITPGKYYLICIDSDYDRFFDINSDLYQSDFCFQTYAYSIENHYYHPDGIIEECCKAAMNTNTSEIPSIVKLMNQWSKEYFSDFIVNIVKKDKDKCDSLIDKSRRFELINNTAKYEFSEEHHALIEKIGLTESNLYLFVRGHNYEAAILELAKIIVERLIDTQKKLIIESIGEDKEHRGRMIKEYMGKVKNNKIENRLKFRRIPDNICYQMIKSDVSGFYGKYFKEVS
ncbi:TPA: DUF4435 domain-containing protein [Photobacterium damselae]